MAECCEFGCCLFTSTASSSAMQAACRLAPHPTSPSAARHFVEANVGEVPHPILELLGLLITEVVTNAIVHAQTSLVVTVSMRGEAIRVEVHDDSPALPVMVRAALDEAGGRGMAIVDGLADDWGVYTEPLHGKTVWFEVGRGLCGSAVM